MKSSVFSLRTLVCTVLLVAGSQIAWSQGLGIGTTAPDPSALVEMQSPDKGLLVPRMSEAVRTGIAAPANGLLVFQTDGAQPGFYYNAGTAASPAWTKLNTGTTGAGDNLGDHTAHQTLRLNGNAITGATSITGTGNNIGTTVGIGVRADGGLNIGQNTNDNISIGFQSGELTTGDYNLFLGTRSGKSNTSGSHNLFNGTNSGYTNTTGNYNQFSGYFSGYLNNADYNYFSGYESGYFNSTGTQNYFSGFLSGKNNHTGSYNYFSGYQSGLNNIDGINNSFIGFNSGYSNLHGNGNVFLGYQSGYSNTADGNIFIGFNSGSGNENGSSNLFIGYYSGAKNKDATKNQFIGMASGYENVTGNYNDFSGYSSGTNNQDGSENQFDGYFSGYSNTSGNANYFSGYMSGSHNTTADNNMFVGYNSGANNKTGRNNMFLGAYSGFNNVDTDNNQFIGVGSGASNLGTENDFSGYQSGEANSSGSQNYFDGYQSGSSNQTGSSNHFSGYQSGGYSTGSENMFIGFKSGLENRAGNKNWAVGFEAGPVVGSGKLSNAGAIGYEAKVSQNNSLVLGGTGVNAVKVGIGTTSPRGILDVAGIDDSYLVANPANGQNQATHLPGLLYLAPYNNSTPYGTIEASVPGYGTNMGLVLRTSNNGAYVNTLTLLANGSAILAGSLTAAGTFYPSDQRLKQNIRPLGGALAAVQQLRGVRYQYRQDIPERNLPAGEQVGVIAQEVERLYPELVNTSADGYKAVNYAQLTPILLEAIKEQQQQIEALKTRAARAEASFGARLQALEAGTRTAQARR